MPCMGFAVLLRHPPDLLWHYRQWHTHIRRRNTHSAG